MTNPSPTRTASWCLSEIAKGAEARDLLNHVDPNLEREFRKIDATIVRLLARVRKSFPDAEYYTASGGFNLMLGKPHDEKGRSRQQLIALRGRAQIGDGDF